MICRLQRCQRSFIHFSGPLWFCFAIHCLKCQHRHPWHAWKTISVQQFSRKRIENQCMPFTGLHLGYSNYTKRKDKRGDIEGQSYMHPFPVFIHVQMDVSTASRNISLNGWTIIVYSQESHFGLECSAIKPAVNLRSCHGWRSLPPNSKNKRAK